MTRKDLNWVFDKCLVKLQGGASLESVLAEYPEWRQELQPVLETVLAVWQSRGSDTVPIAAMTRSRERLHEEIQRRQAVAPKQSAWQRWLYSLRMATVPAVVLLVTFTLGLTGLASVQALPGEPLYPVKLAAERFTLSLPASASQRLAREEGYDNRRSEEVEALIHQQREQEVFFNGYLTQGEDLIWRVDQIVVDVPADMLDSVTSKLGRYVYVHADLMPDGKMVLEWIEDRLYKINGTVQAVDGMRIRIDGLWVELSEAAILQGSAEVGEDVTLSVVRLSTNHLLALDMKVGSGQTMDSKEMPTEKPAEATETTSHSPESVGSIQSDAGDSQEVAQQSTPEPHEEDKSDDSHEENKSDDSHDEDKSDDSDDEDKSDDSHDEENADKTPEPTKKWGDHDEERTRESDRSPRPTRRRDD
jgi:hypothetical protein